MAHDMDRHTHKRLDAPGLQSSFHRAKCDEIDNDQYCDSTHSPFFFLLLDRNQSRKSHRSKKG
jgi:hypothetical protein